MVDHTDPNQVRLTGENSYMRLHAQEQGPMSTRCSHWSILLSPAGPIYADNIALVRWMQQEILTSGEFSDQAIPVANAVFSRTGDSRSFWAESIKNEADTILLTWYDFGEPFVISVPAGSVPGRPLGWSAVFVPARRAQLTLNGRVANGRPFPEPRGERMSSTAGLALSETWVGPY